MKNPGRMENVTRRLIATLLSLSMVILFASTSLAALNCTQCHGDGSTSALPIDTISAFPSYRNITTGAVKGNHGTHSGPVATGQPCARCHGAAATTYISKHAILKHYSIQISASMNYNKGAGVVTAFPQTATPTLGTCSTVNCHFQTITPTWGQTTFWSTGKVANDNNANCTGTCHATTGLNTGAHAEHITAIGGAQVSCSKCHPDYNAAVGTAAFKHATSNTGSIKMSFAAAPNLTGTVTGLRTGSLFLPTPLTASTASCSNVYCHSSGNINNAGTEVAPTTYLAIAWNDAAIGCDGCHGGGGNSHPTYASGAQASATANSHQKHIDNAFSCDYCHYNTVTQTAIPPTQVRMNDYSGHLNRDVNIRLKLNGGLTGTYNKTAKTCSNTYCHGGPPGPSWGALGGATCATCHSANSTLPGGHQAHVQTTPLATSYANMSGNVSSATQYRFSCAACHSFAAGSQHVNGGPAIGPAQVLYGFTSATRNATDYNPGGASAGTDSPSGMSYTAGGSGTCATTYCHSDGNNGIGDKTVFTWASPATTLRCNGCHAVQDWKLASAQPAYSSIRTNAHARHIRGDINTELNVGNGLTCNRCHGATVSAAMNSYTTVGAGVLNKRRHVNKMRDYSGVTTNPNGGPTVSSGQFNATAHTCSNVYCHSNSKIGTTSVKYTSPEAWNSGATLRKCNYCHGRQNHAPTVNPDTDSAFSRYSSTGVPNYLSGAGGATTANTHRQHMAVMGTTDYSNTNVCYSCHAQTLDSTTGKSASAAKFRAYSSRHTSGAYNVKMKAAYGGSYDGTVTTGKTCSTSTCHGTLSPQWGANNDTNSSCTKCHGKPTVLANYSTSRALQAAPGYGQSGLDLSRVSPAATFTNGVSSDAEVGAHDAHLRAVNQYTGRKVLCTDCHTVPSTAIEGNHLNGLTDTQLTWSNLAQNIGTTGTPNGRGVLTPAYNTGTGQCSANYCHGGRLLDGTNTAPIWNQTNYITSYAKTTANCNKCHGAPPPSASYNHSGEIAGWPASTCTGCHGHEGNGSTHIDGTLQAGGSGCNGCHDYDTVGATLTNGVWAGGSWGTNDKSGPNQLTQGWGAHNKHINAIKTRLGITVALNTAATFGVGDAREVCGTCHTNIIGNHSTGGSDQRTINFGDGAYTLGASGTTLMFGTPVPLFNGANNASSSTNPKSCSNLSCHYFTTPNWSAY